MFELPRGFPRRIALIALTLFFVAAGIGHFVNTDFYLSIMPAYLPAHLELVYVSGVFEILGGLAVLPLPTRRLAGYGLMALLLAIFPANIHMALNPENYLAAGIPLWGLYARLPLQFVCMGWAWWATQPES